MRREISAPQQEFKQKVGDLTFGYRQGLAEQATLAVVCLYHDLQIGARQAAGDVGTQLRPGQRKLADVGAAHQRKNDGLATVRVHGRQTANDRIDGPGRSVGGRRQRDVGGWHVALGDGERDIHHASLLVVTAHGDVQRVARQAGHVGPQLVPTDVELGRVGTTHNRVDVGRTAIGARGTQ